MAEEKNRLIEELDQKLIALKEQKGKVDSEVESFIQKRDKLNERRRNLQNEIMTLREERDKLNLEVRQLKAKRNEMAERTRVKKGEVGGLNEKNVDLSKMLPRRNPHALEREIQNIEWKIQTTSLTLQEDKELVGKVRDLHSQLKVHKKLQQLGEKTLETRTEAKAFATESMFYHEQLTDVANRSQEAHEKMLQRIEESNKVRAEADEMHRQFLQTKEKARALQQEIVEIVGRMKQLRSNVRRTEGEMRRQDENALRRTLEKRAMAKLKRGEKLNWQEFQLIAKKKITTQD